MVRSEVTTSVSDTKRYLKIMLEMPYEVICLICPTQNVIFIPFHDLKVYTRIIFQTSLTCLLWIVDQCLQALIKQIYIFSLYNPWNSIVFITYCVNFHLPSCVLKGVSLDSGVCLSLPFAFWFLGCSPRPLHDEEP